MVTDSTSNCISLISPFKERNHSNPHWSLCLVLPLHKITVGLILIFRFIQHHKKQSYRIQTINTGASQSKIEIRRQVVLKSELGQDLKTQTVRRLYRFEFRLRGLMTFRRTYGYPVAISRR